MKNSESAIRELPANEKLTKQQLIDILFWYGEGQVFYKNCKDFNIPIFLSKKMAKKLAHFELVILLNNTKITDFQKMEVLFNHELTIFLLENGTTTHKGWHNNQYPGCSVVKTTNTDEEFAVFYGGSSFYCTSRYEFIQNIKY